MMIVRRALVDVISILDWFYAHATSTHFGATSLCTWALAKKDDMTSNKSAICMTACAAAATVA